MVDIDDTLTSRVVCLIDWEKRKCKQILLTMKSGGIRFQNQYRYTDWWIQTDGYQQFPFLTIALVHKQLLLLLVIQAIWTQWLDSIQYGRWWPKEWCWTALLSSFLVAGLLRWCVVAPSSLSLSRFWLKRIAKSRQPASPSQPSPTLSLTAVASSSSPSLPSFPFLLSFPQTTASIHTCSLRCKGKRGTRAYKAMIGKEREREFEQRRVSVREKRRENKGWQGRKGGERKKLFKGGKQLSTMERNEEETQQLLVYLMPVFVLYVLVAFVHWHESDGERERGRERQRELKKERKWAREKSGKGRREDYQEGCACSLLVFPFPVASFPLVFYAFSLSFLCKVWNPFVPSSFPTCLATFPLYTPTRFALPVSFPPFFHFFPPFLILFSLTSIFPLASCPSLPCPSLILSGFPWVSKKNKLERESTSHHPPPYNVTCSRKREERERGLKG